MITNQLHLRSTIVVLQLLRVLTMLNPYIHAASYDGYAGTFYQNMPCETAHQNCLVSRTLLSDAVTGLSFASKLSSTICGVNRKGDLDSIDLG